MLSYNNQGRVKKRIITTSVVQSKLTHTLEFLLCCLNFLPNMRVRVGVNCSFIKYTRPIFIIRSFLVLFVLTAVLLSGCDPQYNQIIGPLRLPMAIPPSHVLKIDWSKSSNFPNAVGPLKLHRPTGEPAAKVVLFVTLELPDAELFEILHPVPLDSFRAAGWKVSSNGEVEGLGYFVGFAKWAQEDTNTECHIPYFPTYEDEWLLYAVANPLPPWIELTISFSTIGGPEPDLPSVNVIQVPLMK